MNTKYYFSLLMAASLITISCKKEAETAETNSGAPKEIIMPRVQPLGVGGTSNITQVPTQAIQAPAPQSMPVMPQPVTVAKGMNPAHGQPGHRCDIPVGAPLNSPVKNNLVTGGPTKNNPYTVTQTSTPGTTTPATTPAILDPNAPVTAPGTNPPHGQPGHRCDMAVGDPLPN